MCQSRQGYTGFSSPISIGRRVDMSAIQLIVRVAKKKTKFQLNNYQGYDDLLLQSRLEQNFVNSPVLFISLYNYLVDCETHSSA